MIARGLEFLAEHAVLVLAAGVFLGLAWPDLAHWLAPLLVPSVFVILVTAVLRLDWGAMRAAARPGRTVLILLWLAVGAPLVMLGVVKSLALPEGLAAGLVLAAAGSPIVSSVALSVLLGLDGALAVVATLLATLLVPLYLPPLGLWLFGLELEVGVAGFMARLGALAGGGLLTAYLLQRLLTPARLLAQAKRIDGFNVVMLLVFAVAIMDGITATLLDRPGLVLLYLAAAFLANAGLQAAGALLFFWLGWSRALTCGLMSGNRNTALLLAAMAGHAEFEVTLVFVMAQLPVYIMPALLQPIYRRLLGRQIQGS